MPDTPVAERRHSALGIVSLVAFFGIHLGSLSALALGCSWRAAGLAVGLYWLRMFGITAGYHRYFSHRTFKTSRGFQFVLGCLGAASLQKGPLWWAAHHRVHHRWSDTPRDLHSPKQRGFWHSHVGWILSPEHDATDLALVPDLARYPELRWLNRYHWAPALALTLACYALDGLRGVVWGMGVSTVVLWHCTFTINSLAHVWGSRRYETTDTSRNNLVLALITMGEGWHNNHHHYMNSANQGFFWWEIDASYYLLRALSWVRVVRELRVPPAHVLRPQLARAVGALTEAKAAAEATLAGAKAAAEATLTEAREAAEAKLTEAREAAEAKLTEAREAVTEATTAAEARVREVVEQAVEEAAPKLPSTT
jgi:stearoyl-CoA desaturase (delta-9 desaturase)